MDDDLKREWFRWLCGKWTREKPTVPGLYTLANLDGQVRDVPVSVHDHDGVLYFRLSPNEPQSYKLDNFKFSGYWWSAPTPQMPKAPKAV